MRTNPGVSWRNRTRRGPTGLTVALLFWAGMLTPPFRAAEPALSYPAVQELFARHCLDCHASQEPEARLVLESYETLLQGGVSGPAIVPGQSGPSLLVQLIEGTLHRDGKQRIMPPGRRPKLKAEEIARVRGWIDAGAPPPATATPAKRLLHIPQIAPRSAPPRSIQTLAYSSNAKLLAVGRFGEVELVSPESRMVVRTLRGHRGAVNALAFSADGQFLLAGAGEAGLFGEIRQWKVSDGALLRTIEGHRDALYALALAPDGKTLATGSYDQKIKLWEVASGLELKTLSGHQGAIFGLAFRPGGSLLASASADRTVKLWDVGTGERRDTLSQSLKEVHAVAFSPDGQRLYAGGADNRIRIWEISEKALETTNPILESRFAHEGTIHCLALSSDGQALLSSASDRTIKIWNAATLEQIRTLEPQPDWAAAAAFFAGDQGVAVGRLDGSLQYYEAASGKILPPPKPELARSEPRGFQRGTTTTVRLIGAHLSQVNEVRLSDARLQAQLLPGGDANPAEVSITLSVPADLPRGTYDLWLGAPSTETGRIKLHIDDLPQVYLARAGQRTLHQALEELPVSVWASHDQTGAEEELTFKPRSGQSLVFEVAARTLGSKSDIVLTLSDAQGKVLASRTGFGGKDALLFFTFPGEGPYRVRMSELVLGASADHFYRLSIGAFPLVYGCFPLSVPIRTETAVQLIGYNLPPLASIKVAPEKVGPFVLPLDSETYRSRREFTLLASDLNEALEREPNDSAQEATPIGPPGAISGRLWTSNGTADSDWYRFQGKAGDQWIIQTEAAQRGSPADTKLEVLTESGLPIERLLLQAVRDSSVTFRSIDSDTTDCRVVNWEEMELNQLLYLQGEVVKLWRAPQGPDSGFLFYSSQGRRRCYFDTSPAAHAVDDPCYIVEPHPPGASLVTKGLPIFPVYYENDDDADRKLGVDSKLQFTVPEDGAYRIRVTDSRDGTGEDFVYRLVLRRATPEFRVRLHGTGLTVNAGSGQPFTVDAERFDGFEGEIQVQVDHLPAGFSVSTPLVIEAGHAEAHGTLHAALNAPVATAQDWAKVEVTASGLLDGGPAIKAVNNFGQVKLAPPPKAFVFLEPARELPGSQVSAPGVEPDLKVAPPTNRTPPRPLELTIAPGQTISALLRVERNGHDDLMTFTVDNLPHGVIVDNIGLNGVLIPKDQSEREIYLRAARWVPETDRLCYAVESQAGRQTSRPVWLHVRRPAGLPTQAAAASK